MKLRFLFLGLASLLVGCFETTRVAEPEKEGSSSETIAYVKGRLVDAKGVSVVGARARLIPEKFNPMVDQLPKSLETATNSNGEYTFATVHKGTYSIIASDSKNTRGFFVSGKVLSAAIEFSSDTLKSVGNVKVTLGNTAVLAGANDAHGFIYLPQTNFVWQLNSKTIADGYIQLDSLPPGVYPSLAYSSDTVLSHGNELIQNLSIQSGQQTLVDNLSAWAHQGILTASYGGLKLTENIRSYPILVRLDSSNFNFSQAQSGLEDIRFSKMDGTPLAYEVESTDAIQKQAAIWVSLDTVPAAKDSLQFKMYWGNNKANSRSDARLVFGTLASYAAVWHMNSTPANSGLMNFFSNSASAIAQGYDSLVVPDQTAWSGLGHHFNGADAIRIANGRSLFTPTAAGITLEAWFKSTRRGLVGSELISLGNNFGIRVLGNGAANVYVYNYPVSDSSSCNYTADVNSLDNDWHQIVGTLKGNRIDLYEDGTHKGGAACSFEVPLFNGASDIVIGAHGDGSPNFNFNGLIDEVRIFPGIVPGKTIQLNFDLQKSLGADLKLK